MKHTSALRLLASSAVALALGLPPACSQHSPDPAGSGGLVGHLSATSDVAGQDGDPAVGGGGLAVIPIAAMDGPFWDLAGQEPITDPRGWSYLVFQLDEAQVAELGGTVVPIDDDGDFRITVPPGDYGVCRWPEEIGGAVTGCDAVDLPAEGKLEGTVGEAGFRIRVAG